MKNFTHIDDIEDIDAWIKEAIALKKNPLQDFELGKNKTIGLLFFNASLRTRLSTQKAAMNLGMNPIVMNVSGDAWGIEFGDNTVMNGTTAEHIKEAAAVVSQYCDIIAVRAFPTLTNKEKDESEQVLASFIKYGKCHSTPITRLDRCNYHCRTQYQKKTQSCVELGTSYQSAATCSRKQFCTSHAKNGGRICDCEP